MRQGVIFGANRSNLCHSVPTLNQKGDVMAKNTVRVAVDLDINDYEKLKEFCEEHHTPMTRVLRIFVAKLVKMRGQNARPVGENSGNRTPGEQVPDLTL